MTTSLDLAGIIERDRRVGSDLPATSAWAEYQALADRRALLGLLREMREALRTKHELVCSCSFDGTDPDCNLVMSGAELCRLVLWPEP